MVSDGVTHRIVLSLDGKSSTEVYQIVDQTKKLVWGYKVNDLLVEYGLDIIFYLKKQGCRVMADPKLFDIPNTMKNSIGRLLDANVDVTTVHMSAFYQSTPEIAKCLAGVTILTTTTLELCDLVYSETIRNMVSQFVYTAIQFNYGYIVCSIGELDLIPIDKITTIVPGIRPYDYNKPDDQERKATPSEAIQRGADLLVIGRPILNAEDMVFELTKINNEIDCALDSMSVTKWKYKRGGK